MSHDNSDSVHRQHIVSLEEESQTHTGSLTLKWRYLCRDLPITHVPVGVVFVFVVVVVGCW